MPVVHGEKYASDAGLVGSRLRLGALPCGLMLLPVVHGEKYASDAGLVGSRLRLGYLSGWCNCQRPMVFFSYVAVCSVIQ